MYNFNWKFLVSKENLTSPSTHKAIILIASLVGYSVNPELLDSILTAAGSVLAAIEFGRQHNLVEKT